MIKNWLPICDAPKDGSLIIAYNDFENGKFTFDKDGNQNGFTIYGWISEGLFSTSVERFVIARWGGAWDDRTYEYPNEGSGPDWWYADNDFEQSCNPICWLPIIDGYEKFIKDEFEKTVLIK